MLTPSDGRHAWPLHDAAASRHWEAQALAGHPPMALMNRAGRAVASLVMAVARPQAPVLVVVGAGNNGGDGWVAARHLHAAGWPVRVWPVRAAQTADAVLAQREAVAAGVRLLRGAPWSWAHAPIERLQAHGLVIVDALLGLGIRSPLATPFKEAIGWINEAATVQERVHHAITVVSIDLPSGLHPDTGSRCADLLRSDGAVNAHHTLSLLTLKPGLFTHEGRDCAGRIWLDDLGTGAPTDATPPCARLIHRQMLRLLTAARLQADGQPRQGGHKGGHGDVWLLGGATGMGGALLLAARAALAAGAGRVHRVPVVTGVEAQNQHHGRAGGPNRALDLGSAIDPHCPEVMSPAGDALFHSLHPHAARSAPHKVVVAGCGGGKAIADALPALLHGAPALVLDADALNAISREPSLWTRLQARRSHGQLTVLTPHPLEAARLLGLTTAEIQQDRIATAQRLADQAGAVVVLKGSGSIVAAPGLLPWVNASGNARLATGGTGDVLAGWIGGAWSSAGPHAPRSQAGFTQARAALHQLVAACVHLHGLAAQRCAGEQTLPATAVLPASALVDQMALQLVRAAHGHQG